MNVQKRIKRNLLGTAGDLPTSTWPPGWRRRTGEGFSGADLIYVSSSDTQRRYVYLYGEVEAAIEFDLPIDLLLTAEPGYRVRFLYQPTQRASENPRVVAYFNAGADFWTRELQTSTAHVAMAEPGDWLICDDSIELNDANTQPKALLAFQSGLFDPSAASDAMTGSEGDQQVAQEPGWPLGPGELHFSGKALGAGVSPEMAEGVSVFVYLKPLALSTHEPMPEFDGGRARYWVEKDGRAYMPICRGGGSHALTLPVAEDCGWAGGGVYAGTSAYASFTDQNEAGQAGLQVAPTDPDADDDAQPIAKAWDIRNDADEDDLEVNGRTATLCFESVYHADPHDTLACIVGPYKLDIADHRQPDYWPSVEEEETIDLQVKVHYAVSGKPEPGIAVEWRREGSLLETLFTEESGLTVFSYQPTADATVVAVVDSPYKPEADTQHFVVKTIPTRLWAQFELSVDGTEISPDDNWRILPGQSYQLTLEPRADSVLIGQELALAVDPAQSLQLEPTEARPLAASGLTWRVTAAANASGAFTLRLDCIRFKRPPILHGTTNKLSALTIGEAVGDQLDPLAAVDTLTALVPHYDGMAASDKISVTWTGAAGSPAEGTHATPPVEVGTVGEKRIPLPVSVIAYSLGQPVTVSYTVTRDGTPLPAPDVLTLAVGVLPQSALEPSRPRILEAVQEGNGAELDMGSVSGDVTVRVDSWPHVAHGQRTWLRVEGTRIDGSAYEKDLWKGSGNWVSMEWYNRGYGEKDIPRDDLLGLRNGSTLKLEFKASFNQSNEVDQATTFPLRTYIILAALNLSAPSVKQASGAAPNQRLNPAAARDALTVVIPNYGIQPGDQVSVIWDGTAGAGSHTTPVQALPGNREIPLPVAVVAYNLGRQVRIAYTVTRNGEAKPLSSILKLDVQTMPTDALEASRPRILQVAQDGNGAELDLNTVTGSVDVRIDGWPLIAVGQYVWLRAKGFMANGSVHDKDVWGAHARVTQSEYERGDLRAVLPRHYLFDLGDGSTLTLEFKVSFHQKDKEHEATTFALRTYTLTNPLTLLEVRDQLGRQIPDNGSTTSRYISVLGRALGDGEVELFDNDSSVLSLSIFDGLWGLLVTGRFGLGEHRLHVRKVYRGKVVHSNTRVFRIVESETAESGTGHDDEADQ
ncbi:hypothetical protein [Pseudomonas citrulli]|uniref:Ig-like domain-containing protein n=1 Tax=Pseudomonas citrulli TaxID=3064347 RepID=A0ABT9C6D8_9PSED|nr:hypothetical protein [Pseudomonas sp. K18]MDO7899740.1 hypothetical protein [Pseudomonas sp. K18]